jgi:hypothetical protein
MIEFTIPDTSGLVFGNPFQMMVTIVLGMIVIWILYTMFWKPESDSEESPVEST